MAILRAAFPQSRAELDNRETIGVWYEMFKDLPEEKYIAGITTIAKTSTKLFPSIAEIREAALETGKQDIEFKTLQAWQKVKLAFRRAGYMNSVKFDDPVIHNTIMTFGGWRNLCRQEEEDERFTRPQFLKAYAVFFRLQAQGRLQEIPYLPGEAEIHNSCSGHEKHVKKPMLISDEVVRQSLDYKPGLQTALPEKPANVIPLTEVRIKLRTLVDSLMQKGEVA